jgi:malyl-CoA/(S)-citramalyl-CoA lyase
MLDDVMEIVGAVRHKLDVIARGPWDIHYLDQLLAQMERGAIEKPILIHAILETAQGVDNVGHDGASPHAWSESRTGRSPPRVP